jgi:glycosyltransferase involved in cell wall biosynthesis
VLEASLGVVAATEAVTALAAARLRDRPVVHVPLGFVGLSSLPGRGPARRSLALDDGTFVILAIEPAHDATPVRPGARILDRLREELPGADLVEARETDPDLHSRLAAADVVIALEHPTRAGLAPAVTLAVAAGVPTLVTAGSGAARELPEGVVARISPGRTEADETVAIVRRLMTDDSLRARMGRTAQVFATDHADPARCVRPLLEVLRTAGRTQAAALAAGAAGQTEEDRLASNARDEVRCAARELGVVDLPPGLIPLVAGLFRGEGP